MLNQEYGPVDIDCCANSTNHLVKDYYSRSQSFLDAKVSGKTLWINPPFFKAGQFLQHYLAAKAQASSSTAALIVLPYWPRQRWWGVVKNFKMVRYYPAGTHLFTCQPQRPGGSRVDKGPIRWPVCVFYDAPRVENKPAPWPVEAGSQRPSYGGNMKPWAEAPVASRASDCKASDGEVVTGCLDMSGPGMPAAHPITDDKSAVYAISTDPKQLIVLKGRAGQRQLRVLLDSGSHRSWVAQHLCEAMG